MLSTAVHGNRELADQLAYDYANIVHEPLYDYSGVEAGTGPVRYSATGELVTPQSEARYMQQAESLQTAGLALYKEEMAKGTEAADIFDQLIALGDSQPADFRTITRWQATAADWS